MSNRHLTHSGLLSSALSPTIRTTVWLLRIMLPVSLAVSILQYYGVIDMIAGCMDPIFCHIGLPGRASAAFLTAASVTTYAGIAVMSALDLTMREASILSAMALLCHALPMECAVVGKVGSRPLLMAVIRLAAAFAAAFILDSILPEMDGRLQLSPLAGAPGSLGDVLAGWLLSSVRMGCMIFVVIYLLMVIQRVFDKYDVMPRLVGRLGWLMSAFGLPPSAAYLWLVGNVLGISYGAAVMTELMRTGRITRGEANEANYHLIMNHSMIEDTLVYAALGISPLLILSVRLVSALAVVWARRALLGFLRGR
ncbi:MAG: nucleoside recognition domain-containing protein [Prevotella sp.]